MMENYKQGTPVNLNKNQTHDLILKIKLDKIKAAKKKAAHRFKVFGRKSSVHGLKYVVNKKGNVFTKIFWLLVLATSAFCVYVLLRPSLVLESDVNFVPNTLYLEWNTIFPAVTVCETYLGYKNILKKLTDLYPDLMEPLDHTKKKLYSDMLFGVGSCSKSACGPCDEDIPCDFPWREVAEKVRLPCEEMVEDCHYNGWKFPCCKYFHHVDSENGPCIAFNSLLHKKAEKQLFTVNITTGPGELFFKTRTSLSVYVHGPEELATKYLLPNSHFDVRGISMGSTEYLFAMVEMESDQTFISEGIDVRECRFSHELIEGQELHQYLQYSFGACKLAFETEEMYEICGCVHPIRDLAYKKMYCNLTGIICLINYKAEKIKLGIDKHKYHHHEEDELCLPSCVEIELTTINIRNERIPEPGPYNVSVKMANIPTLRFRRTLFRTNLDLVVTLGGLAGLFFGASILSLVETVYLLFRRTKLSIS